MTIPIMRRVELSHPSDTEKYQPSFMYLIVLENNQYIYLLQFSNTKKEYDKTTLPTYQLEILTSNFYHWP